MSNELHGDTPVGRIAVVGAGFAGLICAELLAQSGYWVSILESTPDDLLVYDIQDSKIVKTVWRKKWEELERAGVKFVPNIGKNKTLDDLFKDGFGVVFIDMGVEINVNIEDIPGADLSGVYASVDFLIRGNVDFNHLPEDMREPLEVGRRVVVIGGGNAASDCINAALELGSEDVTCLCNCAEDEISAGAKVRRMAREEGAKYRFLTQPVKFIAGADGRLAAVECVELKLGEPDAQGVRNLVVVEGSSFSVAADTAIISKTKAEIQKYMVNSATLREGVFVGEDCVIDQDFITATLESGRKAAIAIDEYLRNKK